MSKVLVICTGGTLGMTPNTEGVLELSTGHVEETLREMPVFKSKDMPEFTLIEYDPLIDSSQITISVWNKIAQDIYNDYRNYDGFVVLHGTDTMAFTGSALSFMLKNLSKPVILTGAQIPLSSVINDARENIINAIYIAGTCKMINEVCIYFDGALIRANRAVKTSTTEYKAYKSFNYSPLGKVGSKITINGDLLLKNLDGQPLELTLLRTIPADIRFFHTVPSFLEKNLEAILNGADVVVLETFGDGNMPVTEKIKNLLIKAHDADVILINRSQCLKSATSSHTYAAGAALESCHLISAGDQTEETIYAKLLYLFTKELSRADIKSMFVQDICGEITLPPKPEEILSPQVNCFFYHRTKKSAATTVSRPTTPNSGVTPPAGALPTTEFRLQ